MFYIQRYKNKSSTEVVYIELNKTRVENLLSVIDKWEQWKQSQDAFEDNRLGLLYFLSITRTQKNKIQCIQIWIQLSKNLSI